LVAKNWSLNNFFLVVYAAWPGTRAILEEGWACRGWCKKWCRRGGTDLQEHLVITRRVFFFCYFFVSFILFFILFVYISLLFVVYFSNNYGATNW